MVQVHIVTPKCSVCAVHVVNGDAISRETMHARTDFLQIFNGLRLQAETG